MTQCQLYLDGSGQNITRNYGISLRNKLFPYGIFIRLYYSGNWKDTTRPTLSGKVTIDDKTITESLTEVYVDYNWKLEELFGNIDYTGKVIKSNFTLSGASDSEPSITQLNHTITKEVNYLSLDIKGNYVAPVYYGNITCKVSVDNIFACDRYEEIFNGIDIYFSLNSDMQLFGSLNNCIERNNYGYALSFENFENTDISNKLKVYIKFDDTSKHYLRSLGYRVDSESNNGLNQIFVVSTSKLVLLETITIPAGSYSNTYTLNLTSFTKNRLTKKRKVVIDFEGNENYADDYTDFSAYFSGLNITYKYESSGSANSPIEGTIFYDGTFKEITLFKFDYYDDLSNSDILNSSTLTFGATAWSVKYTEEPEEFDMLYDVVFTGPETLNYNSSVDILITVKPRINYNNPTAGMSEYLYIDNLKFYNDNSLIGYFDINPTTSDCKQLDTKCLEFKINNGYSGFNTVTFDKNLKPDKEKWTVEEFFGTADFSYLLIDNNGKLFDGATFEFNIVWGYNVNNLDFDIYEFNIVQNLNSTYDTMGTKIIMYYYQKENKWYFLNDYILNPFDLFVKNNINNGDLLNLVNAVNFVYKLDNTKGFKIFPNFETTDKNTVLFTDVNGYKFYKDSITEEYMYFETKPIPLKDIFTSLINYRIYAADLDLKFKLSKINENKTISLRNDYILAPIEIEIIKITNGQVYSNLQSNVDYAKIDGDIKYNIYEIEAQLLADITVSKNIGIYIQADEFQKITLTTNLGNIICGCNQTTNYSNILQNAILTKDTNIYIPYSTVNIIIQNINNYKNKVILFDNIERFAIDNNGNLIDAYSWYGSYLGYDCPLDDSDIDFYFDSSLNNFTLTITTAKLSDYI